MAQKGERNDIEGYVQLIGDRISRGKRAEKNREIFLSRIMGIGTVLASTLASLGLSNPILAVLTGKSEKITVDEAFSSFAGLPGFASFTALGLFILLSIALAFYRPERIDEKAAQSIALVEAFKRLEVDFIRYLELENPPAEQLTAIYNSAVALETSYFKIIPNRDNCKTIIDQYVANTIKTYCPRWSAKSSTVERREKL